MKRLYLRLKIDDFFDFEANGREDVVCEYFNKAYAAVAFSYDKPSELAEDITVKHIDVKKTDVAAGSEKDTADKKTDVAAGEKKPKAAAGTKKAAVAAGTEKADMAAGRKTIDNGKIRALSNAGWPVGEIAKEMHLTEMQVSNSLYRNKDLEV